MGKQTGLFRFTGRVGDLIGYRSGNEHFVRSAPREVQQSTRSKISSRWFGKASRLGARLRREVMPQLQVTGDGRTVNQLTGRLLEALQCDDLHREKRFIPRYLRGLEGFSFTPYATLHDVLPVTPAVTRTEQGHVQVTVPAIRQHACNPRATHVCIRAIVFNMAGSIITAEASAPVVLPADQPSEAFTLTVPAEKTAVTGVIVEVMSLSCEAGVYYPLRNRKFSVAEVVAILLPEKAPGVVRREFADEAPLVRLPYVPGLVIHRPQLE